MGALGGDDRVHVHGAAVAARCTWSGWGAFAVLYGLVRATLVFFAVAAMFSAAHAGRELDAALVVLAIASISFIGIGMMTAVLPLISPEKGAQLGFVAQGLMLVVSGVYYPVGVMPEWMQWIAKISPATYALRGIRHSILDGARSSQSGRTSGRCLIGAVCDAARPLDLPPRRGHAKRHGKLKRSG